MCLHVRGMIRSCTDTWWYEPELLRYSCNQFTSPLLQLQSPRNTVYVDTSQPFRSIPISVQSNEARHELNILHTSCNILHIECEETATKHKTMQLILLQLQLQLLLHSLWAHISFLTCTFTFSAIGKSSVLPASRSMMMYWSAYADADVS